MKADTQTAAGVAATLRRLTDAYRTCDLRNVMACFAPDPDTALIGTGADEVRIGPEQISVQVERDWAQTESVEMSFTWDSVSAAGPVAWTAAEGTFLIRAGGQDMALPARASLVLENRNGTWLIVHAHFSAPAADQAAGSSV